MTKATKTYFSMDSITKAIFSTIVISVAICLISIGIRHAYQSRSPVSRWYEYSYIMPVKMAFLRGETIEFETSVTRHAGINLRWEDTAFCTDGSYTEKYPTQYRPEGGLTEYVPKGHKASTRKYNYPIETSEMKCRMCGTIIGTTSLGYSKIHSYCTRFFEVNK